MRILFAGPWDLAGKAAAEYFLREGHEVCWLTAEPRRTLWDRKLQGTVCRGQFTATQIVPILRTHRIETVIVLTAGLREGPDACPDPQAGPPGGTAGGSAVLPGGVFCLSFLPGTGVAKPADAPAGGAGGGGTALPGRPGP